MSFAKVKNILRGVGSVIELCPSEQPYPIQRPFAFENDAQAIAHDWQQVGEAFRHAIKSVSGEVPAHGQKQAEQVAP